MILATRHSLDAYVGQVWRPSRTRGRGPMLIRDRRGEYGGPILIVRAVTVREYLTWCEDDTGVPLTSHERSTVARYKFYEIALD